jgi:hypothetical protein
MSFVIDLIGIASSSLAALTSGTASLPLINAKKQKKKGTSYTNSGTLNFTKVESVQDPTFNHFILAGTEINVMIAIDWTGSNGHPANANSLHHRSKTQPNQYVSAILAVCDVLAAYDSDNRFPVFAFGALRNRVTYDILNIGPDQKEVLGVQGIVNAYYGYEISAVTRCFPF